MHTGGGETLPHVTSLLEEHSHLNEEVVKARREIERLNEALRAATHDSERLSATLRHVEASKERLQAQSARAAEGHRAALKIAAEVTYKAADRDAVLEQIALEACGGKNDSIIADIRKQCDSLQEACQTAESEVAVLRAQQETVTTAQEEAQAAREARDKADAEIDRLRAELAQAQEEAHTKELQVKSPLKEAQTKADMLQAELEAVQELQGSGVQDEMMQQVNEALEAELMQLKDEKQELQAQFEVLQQQPPADDVLVEERDALKTKVKDLKKQALDDYELRLGLEKELEALRGGRPGGK